jgi:hypothetical protein
MLRGKLSFISTLLLLSLVLPALLLTPARAQETSHTFTETGKTVSGIFLQYWHTHGGLAQQGYPISDEMTLTSTDGKEYKTQFFERAVFEHHPEYAGTENEVLLKLVGQTFYDRHFGNTPPLNQSVNPTNTYTFQETGHAIGGKFRAYWEAHGGLAQQGYPMTDEFTMVSTDGKEYTTQVFQRAVFELHPEFAGTENEVLLRLLGVEELAELSNPETSTTPTPSATTGPEATATLEAQSVIVIPYAYGRVEIENQSPEVITMNGNARLYFEDIYRKTGKTGTVNLKVIILPFGFELNNQRLRESSYNGKPVVEADMGGCGANRTEMVAGAMYFQIDGGEANKTSCKQVQNLENYKPLHAAFAVGQFRSWLISFGGYKDDAESVAGKKMLDAIDPILKPGITFTDVDGKQVVTNPPMDAYIP